MSLNINDLLQNTMPRESFSFVLFFFGILSLVHRLITLNLTQFETICAAIFAEPETRAFEILCLQKCLTVIHIAYKVNETTL